jgi:GEVED domain/Secretion system C-terminal sorting domain
MKRKKLLTILWMAILSLNVFGQYCITGLGGNCTSRPIADVSMANMANNANGCVSAAGTNFADFTANPSFQINVTAGQSYFLRVKIDGATTARIGAWIDWDQDSIWSTSAEFYNITLAGATLEDSISITVPATAINGNYRLRVRSRPGTGANFTDLQACNNVANGEIEDYTIVVSGGAAPSPYCLSEPISSADDDIGIFSLGGVTNISINNALTLPVLNPASTATYSDFTSLAPIALLSPLSTPISITQVNEDSHYPCFAKVWIDFNHDSIFQNPGELVFTSVQSQDPSIIPGGNILSGSIFLPALSPGIVEPGITRLRVVLSEEDPNTTMSPCSSIDYEWGETEDYLVNLQQAVGCSGTPVAGNTVASDTTLCLGAVANFSINGSTQASGITYQWQENGLNIIGATGPILSDTVTGPSVYTCIVTCNNTSSSATTTTVTLVVNPFSICYCAVAADFSFGTDIGNVTVGSFTNGNASPVIGNSTANNVYTSFTNLTPIPMFSGIPNNIQFTGITNTTFISGTTIDGKVWIDYNQDGTFDPITELAVSGTGNYTSVNGSVISGAPVIPSTALAGVTGMRIMLFEDPFSNPCSAPSFSAGEVEDYLVDIQLASACAGAPNGGNATTSDSLICSNSTINLNANSATIGLGITYQWQASSTLSGPYTNITNATNLLYPTDSVSTPTYFQCEVTCTNSGQSSISAPIFVGVNPADSCYCFTGLGGFCNSASIDGFTIFQTSLGVNTTTNLDNQGNGCSTGVGNQAYTAYGFGIGTDATLAKTDSFTVQIITDGGTASQAKVFTDWNRDGVWNNTNELLTVCSPCSNDTVTATYLIDPSANIGDTIRIRVRTRQATIVDACELLGSGETEDYFIVISNTTVLTVNNVAAKAISNIKLYPNPTTGILNYELPTSVKKASISVSDLLGRTLISKSGNNTNAIDLSVLKNGTYNVTMNLDGKLIQSKVIINK